jgi:Na+/melibiose symporter-like transporter
MTPAQLKGIGITMGIAVSVFATLQFISTYKSGNASWNLLFMVCGMVLILYYTIFNVGKSRRGRKR